MHKVIHEIISWIGFLSFINCMITFPLVFNNIIIPKIEEKIGCKYIIGKFFRYTNPDFLCEWVRYIEISLYICQKYTLSKLTGKSSDEIKLNSDTMMDAKNYRIEDASKFTIFMSFFVWISFIWFFIGGGILYYNK